MEYKSFPCEFKSVGKKGEFEGYVSVYNNIDLGDEIIVPGAFKEVITNRDGRLKLALFHDTERMAGTASYYEDDHGFHLKGRLSLGVSYVKDAYQLMLDGVLDQMSVGYDILKNGHEYKEIEGKTVTVLTRLKLWEGSIVPFGMNPQAEIGDVKSLRDVEAKLRKNYRLSRKEAQAVVSLVKKSLRSDSGGDGHLSDSDISEVISHIKATANNL